MKARLWLTLVLITIPSLAAAQSCIPVTKCGTISAPGNYCLSPGGQATFTSSGGDCFAITAPNVTLESGGQETIQGAGTGAGIHVLSGATNFAMGLFCPIIRGFNVGIEDDANGARFGNSNDCPTRTSNVNYGIYFNNVSGSQYAGGNSLNPGVEGRDAAVWINGGGHNYITSDEPMLNFQQQFFGGGAIGIHIQGSSGNVVYGIAATNSGQGIFIEGGSGNLIYNNRVTSNGIGIRVKVNAPGNYIVGNDATGNSTDDLFQGTSSTSVGCNGDFWLNNTFSTANQSCIQ